MLHVLQFLSTLPALLFDGAASLRGFHTGRCVISLNDQSICQVADLSCFANLKLAQQHLANGFPQNDRQCCCIGVFLQLTRK